MTKKHVLHQENPSGMHLRLQVFILFVCVCAFFSVAPHNSQAQEDSPSESELCQDLSDTISGGVTEKDAISSYILVGHSPCFVIKCAVEGNGSLEDIIEGALYAGVTVDVITRCALLGGAEPEALAHAIETVAPPEGPTPGPYNESPLEKPHVPVSPSGF